jgi:hypothetical protein
MYSWKKLGLVIEPLGYPWARTHAQNPTPVHKEGDVYRVYFAPRDGSNRAQAAWADIDITRPQHGILDHAKAPLLPLGRPGAFDDCGVMPHCVLDVEGTLYMYYTGWSLARVVPFLFFIGLAYSTDKGRGFKRLSEAPVLGRNPDDPFLTAAPWVIREGNAWKMWYVSADRWELEEGQAARHYYRIKHAQSEDGVNWRPHSVAIDFEPDEYALARPVVRITDAGYEMWFCSRGGSGTYRPRLARSEDGLIWNRCNDTGLDVSPSGWDSEMICYPFVFGHKGKTYMLYNGNSYGRDGCGLAVRE